MPVLQNGSFLEGMGVGGPSLKNGTKPVYSLFQVREAVKIRRIDALFKNRPRQKSSSWHSPEHAGIFQRRFLTRRAQSKEGTFYTMCIIVHI